MKVNVNDAIFIDNFDIDMRKIMNSGQCFRIKEYQPNYYSIISGNKYVEAFQYPNETSIYLRCDIDDWRGYWQNYFDCSDESTSIEDIYKLAVEYGDGYIKRCAEKSKGMRILRQDKFETLISFIISQRNNIPKIISTIRRLSEAYSTPLTDKITGKTYYPFPSAEEILKGRETLKSVGLGYRIEYIVDACGQVLSKGIDYFDSVDKLKEIHGVGDKVANCYMLFGMHDLQAFPIDVHIERIITREYGGRFSLNDTIKPYAGVIQQYMFYSEKNI